MLPKADKNKIMKKSGYKNPHLGLRGNEKVLRHFRENSLPDVQLRDPLNPGLEDTVYFFFFFNTFCILQRRVFFIQRCECKYVFPLTEWGDCTAHDRLSALVLREIRLAWC